MGVGRVMKQAKHAGDTAGRVLVDNADRIAKDLSDFVGDFGKKTRGGDAFDGKPDMPNAPDRPRNPPIDRDKNPDWLNDRLDDPSLEYWRRRMVEGDQFNYQNHQRYPQNEVTLDNGKRLDSYRPGEEIVSRKNSQLDGNTPKVDTAKRYIDEVLNKYAPGTGIKGGGDLDGVPILEVPVQNGGVSQDIIDYANSKQPPVVIRDVLGNIYN